MKTRKPIRLRTQMKEALVALGIALLLTYGIGVVVVTADCEQRQKAGYVMCSVFALAWPVTLPLAYWGSQ